AAVAVACDALALAWAACACASLACRFAACALASLCCCLDSRSLTFDWSESICAFKARSSSAETLCALATPTPPNIEIVANMHTPAHHRARRDPSLILAPNTQSLSVAKPQTFFCRRQYRCPQLCPMCRRINGCVTIAPQRNSILGGNTAASRSGSEWA